jgi:hypothetical protein
MDLLVRNYIENDQLFDWMIAPKDRTRYLRDIKRKFLQGYADSANDPS